MITVFVLARSNIFITGIAQALPQLYDHNTATKIRRQNAGTNFRIYPR
jgi:hypothetical protein